MSDVKESREAGPFRLHFNRKSIDRILEGEEKFVYGIPQWNPREALHILGHVSWEESIFREGLEAGEIVVCPANPDLVFDRTRSGAQKRESLLAQNGYAEAAALWTEDFMVPSEIFSVMRPEGF